MNKQVSQDVKNLANWLNKICLNNRKTKVVSFESTRQ